MVEGRYFKLSHILGQYYVTRTFAVAMRVLWQVNVQDLWWDISIITKFNYLRMKYYNQTWCTNTVHNDEAKTEIIWQISLIVPEL